MQNIKFEHRAIKAGAPTSVGILAELTAPKADHLLALAEADNDLRIPRGYVFCVDRSGSMSGDRIENVRATLKTIIARLPQNDVVSVISFASDVTIDIDKREISTLTNDELNYRLDRITANGYTNMQAGLERAMAVAHSMNTEVKVVLLSDGKANEGVTNRTDLARILTNAPGANWIMPAAIGIGRDYDEDLLNAISEVAEGSQYAGITIDEVVGALESEIDDLVPPTYSNVALWVNLNPNVLDASTEIVMHSPALRVFSDKFNFNAELHNMSSEAIRNYLVELKLKFKPGLELGNHAIGMIGISAYNAETGERDEFTKELVMRNIPTNIWRSPRVNADVAAEMRQVRLDRARAEVIELMNAGRVNDARALIRQLEGEIREALEFEGLTERSRLRMSESMFEVNSYMTMDEIELKKRMYEAKNRKDRGRDDFRGRN